MKEYKLIETTKENAEKLMNNMAKHGWEVVSMNLLEQVESLPDDNLRARP